MLRYSLIALLTGLSAGAIASPNPGGFFEVAGGTPPAELLIDFEDVDAEEVTALAEAAGVTLRFNSEFSDGGEELVVATAPDRHALERLTAFFKGREGVEAVEPNYVMHVLWRPDDPLFKSQWHLDMIHMEEAWGRSRGRGVVVAVIDTGVSSGAGQLERVEDLTEAQLVAGYDFVHDTRTPDDDHAHGTHVAGTVAQATNNGVGVAGVAFAARIMPIKVLDASGRGTVSDIAEGIRWAVHNGADVINMSLGGPFPSLVLQKAVRYARSSGVLVVCAAGNSGRKGVGYPAAFNDAMAVAAIGPDRALAPYSSWGAALDISAPGGDTTLDLNNDGIPDGVLQNTIVPRDPGRQGYFAFQGTSMASPHVAGVAALVISQGVTDPDAVERILKATAQPMASTERFGAGLVDADAATARVVWRGGLWRATIAFLLTLLIAWRGRRAGAERTGIGASYLLGLVVGACGLFFLRSVEVSTPWLFFVTRPAAEWPGVLLGMGWHLNALVGSAFVPLVPVLVLSGFRRLRPLCAGFAIGYAAYLLAVAIDGSVNVRWVPWHGLLDRAWLLANALLALFLGWAGLPRR